MLMRTGMANILINLFGIISVLVVSACSAKDANAVLPTTHDEVVDLINTRNYFLVLFYGDKCEKACQDTMKQLARVADATLISDLKVVSNEGHIVAESYGVQKYPALMFFRSGYPILYPTPLVEADDVVIWMEQSRSISTKILTDQNFEHDTQASTGATTGDWFVMFYSKSCTKLTATWEALANELKHRMNVAKVDISKNMGLLNRFSIQKCPTLIFFRAGKMYRYDLPEKDYKSLLSFANGWYKNVKGEKVTAEPTLFDQLTSSIADSIKERLDGPNGIIYVIGGFLVVFVTLLGIILFFTYERDNKDKFD